MSKKSRVEDSSSVSNCAAPVIVREPLSRSGADDLARLFKALADPVRLRLLSLITCHAGGEACVCELSTVFELTGPTISHHLKVLREAGLIIGERRGTWIFYRVVPKTLHRASAALALDEVQA